MNNGIVTFPQKKDSDYWGRLAQRAVTDELAFTELYEHFFPRVYQHLMGKTKDSALADEMVSDTFIRMYQHLKDYDPDKGAFSTWLFRIAQNVLYKHYGSKTVTMHAPWEENFDPAAPEQYTPEKQALTREENEELLQALASLSERQQKIVEMTYWLGMKSGEIGEALGIDANTVRTTLRQAREKLKKLLEDKE